MSIKVRGADDDDFNDKMGSFHIMREKAVTQKTSLYSTYP